MTKTSRYKGLVLGSFLVPEIDMIFGDGVGASLVRRQWVSTVVAKWVDQNESFLYFSQMQGCCHQNQLEPLPITSETMLYRCRPGCVTTLP